ncbi:MAG: hypothetical protein VX278_10660 [Myxococcota bacterium]|nr:hypothetical protein [Myxococcota bacterium]
MRLNGSLSSQWDDTGNRELYYDGASLLNEKRLHGLEIGFGGMRQNFASELSLSFTSSPSEVVIESPYPLLVTDLQQVKMQVSLGIGKQGSFWGAWSGAHLGWVNHRININDNAVEQEANGIPKYNITTEEPDDDPAFISNHFRTGIKGGIWFGGQTGVRVTGEIGTDLQGFWDRGISISVYSKDLF